MVDEDDEEQDVTDVLPSSGRSGMLLVCSQMSDFDLRVNVLSLLSSAKSKSMIASSKVMSIGNGAAVLPVGRYK